MKRLNALLALLVSVPLVLAQTLSTNPPLTPATPTTPPVVQAWTPISFTPAGRQYAQAQLQRYVTQRASQLPSRAAVLASGLSAEADIVEQAWLQNGRWVVPHHVGKANAAMPTVRTLDPAAEEGARAAARKLAGRAPTAAQVAAQVAAFDQRVAALNQQLVTRRADIALSYRNTGHFPREMEAPLLGVKAREALARNPDAATKSKLQQLYTKLANELAPEVTAP